MYRTVPRLAGYVFHLVLLPLPVQFQLLRGIGTSADAVSELN